MKSRESNYDLLRIICCTAVIMAHVCSTYLDIAFSETAAQTDSFYTGNLLITSVLNTLPRITVPCFVMISGAFILDDKRNMDFKYFYRKSLKSTWITASVFWALYTIYVLLRKTINIISGEEPFWSVLTPIKNAFLGKPAYHMWYMAMLFGVYILVPVILILENEFQKRDINIWGGDNGGLLDLF